MQLKQHARFFSNCLAAIFINLKEKIFLFDAQTLELHADDAIHIPAAFHR